MSSESTVPLVLQLTLLVLLLFLLLNHAEELITFGLRLLSHHHLFLNELSATGHIESLLLFCKQHGLFFLISAGLALSLFESALGSECVNFTLAIGSAFLKFSQALNFELLLLLNTACILSILLFFGDSFCVVTHDFQIFITLLSQLILLTIQGNFVGYLDFREHLSVTDFLSFSNFQISSLLQLNCSHHLLLLALELLTLLDAHDFTFLDLLNDNCGATALGLNSQAFALIFSLEGLQALDFHHEIEAFLLRDPFAFEVFVLCKLLVTHGYDLGVEGHLVHVLDIVVLFIELLLGLGKESFCPLVLFNFNLCRWQLRSTGAVHLHHLCFTSLGGSLLLSLLLLVNSPRLLGLLLGRNLSLLAHALEVRRSNDCS